MQTVTSVLSLDPGRTTGYAIGIVHDTKPFIAYHQQELDHKGIWQLLDKVGRECDYQLNIVCEEFHFRRSQTGVDYYPIELIGIVNYFVQCYPMNALFWQNPSVQSKRGYWSDAKLKEMGLYQKQYEHGRSAVKHLLHWLQFSTGAKYAPDMDTCELVTMDWAERHLV